MPILPDASQRSRPPPSPGLFVHRPRDHAPFTCRPRIRPASLLRTVRHRPHVFDGHLPGRTLTDNHRRRWVDEPYAALEAYARTEGLWEPSESARAQCSHQVFARKQSLRKGEPANLRSDQPACTMGQAKPERCRLCDWLRGIPG